MAAEGFPGADIHPQLSGACEAMVQAIDVARHFLSLSQQESAKLGQESDLTHLKLQKLLYYAQAWSLVFNDEPLFPEEIQAWERGPVTPVVWATFTKYERKPIAPETEARECRALSQRQRELLQYVWNSYKDYQPRDLSSRTHLERPWLEAYKPGPDRRCENPITLQAMKDFYTQEYERACPAGMKLADLMRARQDVAHGRTVSLAKLKAETGHGV